MDDDEEPFEELKRRALPDNIKEEMEGYLNDNELNNALINDMKPNYAPGIDGFTVNPVNPSPGHYQTPAEIWQRYN